MNKHEIKSFRRERKLRPYKNELKNAVRYFKLLGANLLITGVALVGGWIALVGFLLITQ